jgi:hypothetical protein
MAGIDPNRSGFQIDPRTFKLARSYIEENKIELEIILNFWKPLQSFTPEEMEENVYSSKQFFKWFKEQKLETEVKSQQNPLSILYFRFPYTISNSSRRIFYDSYSLLSEKISR